MRLEDLQPGSRVRGIVPGQTVHLIAILPAGPDARRVIFSRSDGTVDQQILMRANEAQLILIEDLPTPFDANSDDFKLAAEALRIRLEAPDAVVEGNYQALPHQLDAVYGHLLEQIPLRFLLADDPGAGKTIMAGLFLKELQLRGALDRCLIIAPGGLVAQWQTELREKFGMDFTVLDKDDIAHIISGGAMFDRQSLVIARMDQVARNDDLIQVFRGARLDVVIVDEAHRMSAHYAGAEVKATKRYRLGMALRDVARHFLLLTATPHAGKEEDFQLFMRLIDPERYEGRYRDDVHRAGADGLMLRRSKEDLLTLEGRPLFTQRATYTVRHTLSPAEADLYEQVTTYVREEFDRADTLGVQQRNNVGFALTVLQRRLASSPHAILASLERRRDQLTRALSGAKTNRTRGAKIELDAIAEEYPADEREEFEDEVVTGTTAARTSEELKREIAVVSGLIETARRVRDSGTDRKWLELRRLLEMAPQIVDAEGNVRKIIVFTEHRDTLDYLVERTRELLGRRGVVASIHGGLAHDRRLQQQKMFTGDPACRVLIATDAAGEGINLQAAHLMVNYDLPWNPNRLEQRFGRIHRIGQSEMCHLWNLVAGETREGSVYETLLRKLEQMNEALDGKIFDVLGEVFEGAPLHELLVEAVRRGDDPEVRRHLERVIDDRVGAVVAKLAKDKALSPEVYRQVAPETYRRRVQEARARRLQPYIVEAFFRDAFRRLNGRLTQRGAGRWEIPHIPGVLRDFDRSVALPVRYPLVTFGPTENGDGTEVLGPGRPLFDLLLRHTESEYGDALTRGTVLVDRLDPSVEPRLLAAIESEIVDGADTQVGRRFTFVEIDEKGQGRQGARFLDYEGATQEERSGLTALLSQPWLARPQRTAEEWATSAELPYWYAELSDRRRQHVARARELVTDRLKQEIGHWERMLARAESAPLGGQEVARTAREVRRLRAALDRRLAELEQQESTKVVPPRTLAVALVVPQGLLDQLAGQQPSEDIRRIELRAIRAVEAAERRLGRSSRLMPQNNPGYDIESTSPDGELIFIEVKGRIAGAETFFVTNQEIRCSQNAQPHYRLALVSVSPDGPAYDTVRYVENPFEGINVTALMIGVEFRWSKAWASGLDPW